MTHKHSSPIVVQAFAAPFARYPGYVISATRSRDQHVIVIVLTQPASKDSRLVRKLAHAQHHAAPPKRHQNNVKIVTGRKIGVDRPWFNDSLFTANHLHNLASSLFNMHSSSNLLSPAQNTFVSSAKSINFTKFDTLQISLI